MKAMIALLIPLTLFSGNRLAKEEVYFSNKFDVEFTKEQYDFVSKLYFEGYQEDMTWDELNDLIPYIGFKINEYHIDYSTQYNINSQDIISDTDKTLKVKTVCNSKCAVTSTLTWKNEPVVKSYDLFGAYSNKTISNRITTKVYKNNVLNSTLITPQTFFNGFGQTFKMPSGNVKIIQTFEVNTGGNLHVSYQHAISSISHNNSKNYTISPTGLGGVFNHTYSSYYDGMSGIYITI